MRLLPILLVFTLLIPSASAQVLETERITAFQAIISAEDAGADVSSLVSKYDEALRLIDTGDLENISTANLYFTQIISEAAILESEAIQQGNIDAAIAIGKVVVLVAAAVVVWMRGDQWFWRLWRRTRRGYMVE